jgi:capsule polysaccharide export protein KpsE/RkpR
MSLEQMVKLLAQFNSDLRFLRTNTTNERAHPKICRLEAKIRNLEYKIKKEENAIRESQKKKTN